MDFGGNVGADAVEDVIVSGFHLMGEAADPEAATVLLNEIRALRRFDSSLFLSEAEFDAVVRPESMLARLCGVATEKLTRQSLGASNVTLEGKPSSRWPAGTDSPARSKKFAKFV